MIYFRKESRTIIVKIPTKNIEVIFSDEITEYKTHYNCQNFPLYLYEKIDGEKSSLETVDNEEYISASRPLRPKYRIRKDSRS